MIRLTRPFALAAALSGLAGCAPSNPAVQIEGILPLDAVCVATPGEVFALQPRLDTSASSRDATVQAGPGATPTAIRPAGIQYIAIMQVANAITNTAARYPLMANPNSWQAEEAEVELRGIDGLPLNLPGLPSRFRVPTVGFVASGTGSESGRGVVPVEVIPSVYGDALAGQTGTILVATKLTGSTAGGSTQTTGEYVFPLQLCDGCLFRCTPNPDMPGTQVVVPSCLPGQDAVSAFCLPVPPA